MITPLNCEDEKGGVGREMVEDGGVIRLLDVEGGDEREKEQEQRRMEGGEGHVGVVEARVQGMLGGLG